MSLLTRLISASFILGLSVAGHAQKMSQTISGPEIARVGGETKQVQLKANAPLILDVNAKDISISFQRPDDYEGSKVVKNCFQLKVNGPELPWVVTASISFEHANLDAETAARLSRLVQLRVNNGIPIRLSDRPLPIITFNPNNPSNSYMLDFIIDPPFDINTNMIRGLVSFNLQLL